MTVEIRRTTERFVTRAEGRSTRHSFSFGEHYDAARLGFGPIVCHDDHFLGSGAGFPEHPHSGLEIVTWVLSGALEHSSSGKSHRSTIEPGTVGVLSAGSGVVHSEMAGAAAGPTRFVQVWLTPDDPDAAPSYATAPVDVPSGALVPVASGHHPEAALRLGTAAATFWVARLATGDTVTLPDDPLQHVFVARGALTRSSLAQPMSVGDAFLVTDSPGLEVTAAVPTELLVWSFRAAE